MYIGMVRFFSRIGSLKMIIFMFRELGIDKVRKLSYDNRELYLRRFHSTTDTLSYQYN